VKRVSAVLLAVLALLGLSVLLRFFGATTPAGALLLGAAAMGCVIGLLIGTRLPPAGPLFEPLLVVGTRIIPALLAGYAAAVLAGHLRSGTED
jgi:hypothetical protein